MWRSRIVALPVTALLGVALCACERPGSSAPHPLENSGFSHDSLLTRSGVSGPLFSPLEVGQIGVDFVHQWPTDPVAQAQLAGPFAGGGVAAGDYDADGYIDLYLTRPSGGGALYRNLGGWRFENVTQSAGLPVDGWTTGASFVDLDNDGDLDLFVGRFDGPDRHFENVGGGRFKLNKDSGLAFEDPTISAAFADWDRDGDLDAYLVTYRSQPPEDLKGTASRVGGKLMPPEAHRPWVAIIERETGPVIVNAGHRDRLLRNDNGRFVDVSDAAGVTDYEMGLSARFFDADGDLWPELYVANDFFGADHFYRNVQGQLKEATEAALPHTPWFSMGLAVGDINNDARLDLLASDMSGTTHFKQKLSMGDMTDDGWFLEHPTPRQYMRNALYVNTGTTRFAEAAQLAGLANTDWTWTPRFTDLDEDGRLDLFVTNGMTRDFSDSDTRARLKAAGRWQKGDEAFWARQPQRRDENLAFQNLGDLKFRSVGALWGLSAPSVSFGMVAADLDGDGDQDLLTLDFDGPPRVYRNNSHGTHRVVVRLKGTQSNRFGVGAHVEIETKAGKQLRDVAVGGGFMSSGAAELHFGLGAEDRVEKLTVRWPSGAIQTFTDLAADRRYTITESGSTPKPAPKAAAHPWFQASSRLGARHNERPFDDFARQPLLPNQHSTLGPGLAWGDVNGDGHDDLFVGGAAGEAGRIYLRVGEGFRPALTLDSPESEDLGAVFFDADGDGDADLYVVSGGVEGAPGAAVFRDRLYLNTGQSLQRAAPEVLPDDRSSGGAVVAGDVDGDGDLDLFVGGRVVPGRYPERPTHRLLRNDSGRFVDVAATQAPELHAVGMVTGALLSDVDADGDLDLLLTTEWGPVHLFLNDGRGQFVDGTRPAGLADRLGWYNGITGGDLDRDGDVDYVVTGFGLNTKYHPSVDKPAVLYSGRFAGSEQPRLIEAKYIDKTLFPVRGRSCSSDAMPELADEFGTFADFARADLAKIYGGALETATRLEANTLESVALINDGRGHFTVEILPTMAQIAPAFGAVIGDWDLDGAPDVWLAQNFYGPQRETGRMDGGIGALLERSAKGAWTVVPPAETGLVVPADARAATAADLNGDSRADLVVATNDGPVLAFESTRAPAGVRLRLRGPKGNPTGIGARLLATPREGEPFVTEVYGGQGYLSQAPGTHFLGPLSALSIVWPDGQKTDVPLAGDMLVAEHPAAAK